VISHARPQNGATIATTSRAMERDETNFVPIHVWGHGPSE